MKPHEEFWHDLTIEVGSLTAALHSTLEMLNAVEENVLSCELVQIEFHVNRAALIEKVNAIEKQILELQRWISDHAISVGSYDLNRSE